jgi:DNA mismatch repair protein MutH
MPRQRVRLALEDKDHAVGAVASVAEHHSRATTRLHMFTAVSVALLESMFNPGDFLRVAEALPRLEAACGRRFGDLFAKHPNDLRTNKGHVGQLLLTHIGLTLDSQLCDFEDGELKTNKCSRDGKPLETMFITQISGIIDQLVSDPPEPFLKSPLYEKIRQILYVPVVKEKTNVAEWYFIRCIRIEAPLGSPLFHQLDEDYRSICSQLRSSAETSSDRFIHTANGRYLQVRSKDSKPYHPIHSATFNRFISNKNHAFYFRKEFMIEAIAGRL